MKISFAINCYNELKELKNLIPFLLEHKKVQDEIVVLYDSKNGTLETLEYLRGLGEDIILETIKFNRKDFSHLKNKLNSYCSGDYIFNIDADEIPDPNLIQFLYHLNLNNPECEVFWVPRINTVEGITLSKVKEWGWNIGKVPSPEFIEKRSVFDEELELLEYYDLIIEEKKGIYTFYVPIINPFEPQLRVYKNTPKIKWVGEVHEKLKGYRSQMFLPKETKYCLYHFKHISKQITQNELYEKITNIS